jgi:hypothetical protein
MKKLFLAVCFFCAAWCFAAGPGAAAGIRKGANFKKLYNKAEVITSRVEELKEENAVWISMEVDVHMVSDVPLEKLRAAITDYNNYVKIFKRTTASSITAAGGAGTVAFFEVTVGALGITVVSSYSVLLKVLIDEPGKFLVEFTHYSDDGTVRNVRGYWYFESVEVENKTCTYLRNYSATDSLQTNILQKTAASLFMGAEYMGMLRELLAAAKGRN